MCLSKITIAYDKPSDLIVDGWKQFNGTAAQPCFQSNNYNGKREVPLDRWLKAEGVSDIKADDSKMYRPGFHIYADEKELRDKARYRRVYVRRVTCAGMQNSLKCVIAQEMYVPSDPDAWPPNPKPIPPDPAPKPPEKKLLDRIKKATGRKP